MLKTVQTKNFTWIDIDEPTSDDIAQLRDTITIHPLAIEEFAAPTVQSRATQYPNGVFLAVHVPLYDKEERTTYAAELDIILTETHLITGHALPIYQLDQFFDRIMTTKGAHIGHIGDSPAHLLYAVLEMLINTCFPRLDHVTEKIMAIESGVFHGEEARMVQEISHVKRDILNFRRTIMPQRSILESLIRKSDRFVPEELHPYLHDLIGSNIRLWNILESQKETIESLESTNDTLLSTQLNAKMRVITIFSSVLIPIALYASIFGINTKVPLQFTEYGFQIHIAIMVGIALATLAIFRWRRWI